MAQMAALHAEVLRLAPAEAGPLSPLGEHMWPCRAVLHWCSRLQGAEGGSMLHAAWRDELHATGWNVIMCRASEQSQGSCCIHSWCSTLLRCSTIYEPSS